MYEQLCFPSTNIDRDTVLSACKKTDLLNKLNLDLDSKINWENLSPGQKQLISVTRMFSHEPKVLFMDEPTSSLNINNTIQIYDLLKADKHLTLCTISHDESLLKYHDTILELSKNGLTPSKKRG